MKIICINESTDSRLKSGKEYTTLRAFMSKNPRESSSGKWIYVFELGWCESRLFMDLDEYRNKQVDKLL